MKKMNIFKAYGLMWRNIFNYRGISERREYWLTVLAEAVIAAVGGCLVAVSAFTSGGLCYAIGMVLIIIFGAGIIPFVSLTVRRLHDTGRSGWWTCLLLAVGVGTLCLLFICASASTSSFRSSDNSEVCVYGPPSWFSGSYNADDNQNEDVYGPPDWFDEDDENDGEQ